MYNPIGGSAYEFIRLKNIGDQTVDLSGAYFEGIQFQFPLQSYLGAGASFTLARNPKALLMRYPAMTIDGTYQGKLSNDGEKISLKGAGDQTLFSVLAGYHGVQQCRALSALCLMLLFLRRPSCFT